MTAIDDLAAATARNTASINALVAAAQASSNTTAIETAVTQINANSDAADAETAILAPPPPKPAP